MYIGLHVSTRYSYQILMKLEFFLDIFSKNHQISHFVKICSVGAELLNTDRQTDRHDEVNSRLWQFCERACKHPS